SGWVPADSGTLVVIEGQRFSTRAESLWFAAQGWTLVGMTGHPEAVLARELALCYTPLALVTDLDAGLEEGEGVTQAEVFEVFAANIKRLRDLVATIISALPADREDDLCAHALDGINLPFPLPQQPPFPLPSHPARRSGQRSVADCGGGTHHRSFWKWVVQRRRVRTTPSQPPRTCGNATRLAARCRGGLRVGSASCLISTSRPAGPRRFMSCMRATSAGTATTSGWRGPSR